MKDNHELTATFFMGVVVGMVVVMILI